MVMIGGMGKRSGLDKQFEGISCGMIYEVMEYLKIHNYE